KRTYVMGVVNVTPDSFSDGGEPARDMSAADLVDIGGESTRPGATPVSAGEEWQRIAPSIRAHAGTKTVSVDTYKAEVAARALDAGAEIVNDISGGRLDGEILGVCARAGAALIVGHLRGTPADMAARADYRDLVREVKDELAERVA